MRPQKIHSDRKYRRDLRQHGLHQSWRRGREVADMTSHIVDALGLVGQKHAPNLASRRNGNLERPTAPVAGGGGDEGVLVADAARSG